MHKQFMLAALEQAWLGRGITAPNPSVGAVVVHNEQIIAKDWHRGAGTAHAERLVLSKAKIPKGSSLYITLEPCNHWGKTPPCVDIIIASGISTVIYAYKDPNPIVAANNTTAILEKAGINVIYYPLDEVNAFYQSYHHWVIHKKPWVTAKIAHSFDGKIAADKKGRLYLSNESCNTFTHQQRQYCDVILTTAETVIKDDPIFNVRLQDTSTKPLAVLDRRLRIEQKAKIFSEDRPCHIFHDAAFEPNKISNGNYYPILVTDQKIDLDRVLSHLGKLGYHDVWVEAGGTFFSALHQHQLVNTTYIYLTPIVVGTHSVPAYHYPIFTHAHTISWLPKENNMIACVQWQEASCSPV